MTKQSEIINDPKYIPVLDKGFVGLVDHMGSDSGIVQAARVSYGSGTKSVREDRGLIRYLLRHRHTSPFEMANIKFHIKLPIFIMRQLVRHRTASLNEYSARYSIMTDEFYVPEAINIKPQSKDNKQGRSGELTADQSRLVQEAITDESEAAYEVYRTLLGENKNTTVYGEDEGWDGPATTHLEHDQEFPGIARELARMVLPVNYYTELYWSQNLHNLLHLIKLRVDSHAQWEIQQVAQAMYDTVKPLFPLTVEAFEDYVQQGKNFSRMEVALLKSLINEEGLRVVQEQRKQFAEEFGLSVHELDEFFAKLK